MEKKNKNKKNIIIGISSLVLVTLILLGLTYAYYRTRIIGNDAEKSITVTSKRLEITYIDGTATLSTEGKIEPGFTATKQFSVKNTGDATVGFNIIIDNVVNEFNKGTETRGAYNDWQYKLYSGTTVVESNLIKSGDITTASYQILITDVSIDAGVTNDYLLVIEYLSLEDVDQSADMGSTLSLRVNIENQNISWEEAEQGSLLYALKTNQPSGTSTTAVGEVSAVDEARILTTEDDYGTSYVYRGAVTNNYVTLDNMCYRIVRVEGDGSIKLILEDKNNSCENAQMGDWSITSSDVSNTATEGENINPSLLNDIDNQTNATNMSLITDWFEAKLSSRKAILKPESVCLGDTTSTLNYEHEISLEAYGYDYNTTVTVYQYVYGNVTRVTNNPSLICAGEKGEPAYAYAITADEVVFAGAKAEAAKLTYYYNNYDYYLNSNSIQVPGQNTHGEYNKSFFTATVAAKGEDFVDGVFVEYISYYRVGTAGSLVYDAAVPYPTTYRPMITLKSTVFIEGGDGTRTNPYVVI